MRTNYSGFALAVSMGLVVLLIGFLALSAGGLVQFGPAMEEVATGEPIDTLATVQQHQNTIASPPVSSATLANPSCVL